VQTDVLDGRPDNGQATGLGGEHINLIGALPHIAEEAQSAHGWSECVGASSEGTRKTSTGALRPQRGCGSLLDSAQRTWL
jgi:hypothetical protein